MKIWIRIGDTTEQNIRLWPWELPQKRNHKPHMKICVNNTCKHQQILNMRTYNKVEEWACPFWCRESHKEPDCGELESPLNHEFRLGAKAVCWGGINPSLHHIEEFPGFLCPPQSPLQEIFAHKLLAARVLTNQRAGLWFCTRFDSRWWRGGACYGFENVRFLLRIRTLHTASLRTLRSSSTSNCATSPLNHQRALDPPGSSRAFKMLRPQTSTRLFCCHLLLWFCLF